MNEQRARQAGYSFTGCYSHDKEEMKTRAKELRNKGNKAIVVNIPPSKYNRGSHGMGYSVYMIESSENRRAREIEQAKSLVANAEAAVEKVKLELAKAEIKAVNARSALDELEKQMEM